MIRRHRPDELARARRTARFAALSVVAGVAATACQAMPPAMTTALVGFGQDVLAAAAHNFAPQYAQSVQNLFFAMAETATGAPFAQQPYAGPSQGAYGQDPYGQDPYAQDPYAQDPYGQDPYAQDPYAQDPYAQNPYAQDAGAGEYAQDAYSQGGYAPAAQAPAYSPPPGYGTQAGVGLEVALLAQQRTPDGQVRLRPVNDGEVLYDGRGDPSRGDKIKIFFAANCACYVYVIGIDATGYVAQIFPEGDLRAAGPVSPGAEYLLPEGSRWWGLDDYRGVEQIYFIASRQRRPDIESAVAQLAGRRPALPADYRPVREPAIVAMNRGLVQVESAAPTSVASEYGASQQFSPTLFQSTVQDADLVITRWFRHE
jgi:hypothetical protein